MRKVTLEELCVLVNSARESIWEQAKEYGREPKIYLHWTAGHYYQKHDDYHINIDGDGNIFISVEDLSTTLPHTWRRNSGAIGITIDGCFDMGPYHLGTEPPKPIQIETMARVIQVVADGLWLTINKNYVLTHGEAADNIDGLNTHEKYGPTTTVERWDLQYLGTPESPKYVKNFDDPTTGGNVLRGKAAWYKKNKPIIMKG